MGSVFRLTFDLPSHSSEPSELFQPSFPRCKGMRAKNKGTELEGKERGLVLLNCVILNPSSGTTSAKPTDVLLLGGKIENVGHSIDWSVGHNEDDFCLIDCQGLTLMPGLCDAHVHCTAITANLAALMSHPESYVTARAAEILNGMIWRGFTTVRDVGGADFGLAKAVSEGLIIGPRILFAGHALSQTGGHGDFRGPGEDLCGCGAALRGIGRVCDGDAEVRRAARDELRKGAHCIKIMASGGVSSSTDKLTSTQFSVAEMVAIVEEAQACGTYVCAHAYMPNAIKRAVECGVRSIEHGNWLDDECANLMAHHSTYLVPTLITYQKLVEEGPAAGLPIEMVNKVGNCVSQGLKAVALAHSRGVPIVFGSDLLGDMHIHQSKEFELRAQVLPLPDIIRSATVNAARLFGMEGCIGCISAGAAADLILVEGNPLEDISILSALEGKHIRLVIKDGLLAKGPVCLAAVNDILLESRPQGAVKSEEHAHGLKRKASVGFVTMVE